VAQIDTPRPSFSAGDDIAAIIGKHARRSPDRVALISGESQLTWQALDERLDRAARAFIDAGVAPGDGIAVLSQNSIEYVEAFLGALRAGACVVPLPCLASKESLQLMLDDSGAKVLLWSELYADVATSLGGSRITTRAVLDGAGEGTLTWSAFTAAARDPVPEIPIAVNDAFDVIYSSGTTGTPKGIVHSHGARKASYGGSRARYFGDDTVNVIATPFYSNTTCITWFLTLAQGGVNLLLGKFSPAAFLDAVKRHGATHAMLVPVQYERILGAPEFASADVSTLRYLFSTSAPLRPSVKERILAETGAELVEIYGLTEGGAVTVLEARQHPDKLATVGIAAPGCEIRVVDEAGKDVPAGHTGEIIGRSANMMSGYLNRPDDTSAMLHRDERGVLYFKTGDIGRLDGDGFLQLLDRKKDVIISGGFNVYASDLEAVLAVHDAVLEVAVVAVPSERWGETPLAVVALKPGASATAAELIDYTNARVGKAQRLSAVEFIDELPKSAIGKVLKRELRDRFAAK
jgi:long-chain acyl-CoA synthetase